jgi:hypothetical protein
MAENNDIEEFIDLKQEKKDPKRLKLKDWFDGSIITRDAFVKQLPFILFLSFLAVIYIGNRYHAEKIVRDIDKLQNNVNDLRAESITTASELIKISRQSEVARQIENAGIELKESVVPPKKIKKY